jgi:hypothetical protein
MGWFKKVFGKKQNEINVGKEPQKVPEYVPRKSYNYKRMDGEYTLHLGDKVICRSNEADPLMVGNIVEFWDNEGKWGDSCIPQVRDINDGKIWGVMGVIRPYSDKLMEDLKDLKPLEQWNYFIPDEHKDFRYDEETMKRKEESYKRRQNVQETS